MENIEDLEDFRQELSENPQYADVIEQAFEMIKVLRIPVNGYSGEAPKMPKHITNLTNEELGEHLNTQAQWAGYVGEKLAEFESYRIVLENELEFTQAYLHTEYLKDEQAKKTKITERKELLKTDKRFIPLNKQKLLYEVISGILKAHLNSTNNNWTSLSRQITLKGQDDQRGFRTNNALSYVPESPRPRMPSPRGFENKIPGPSTTPIRKTRSTA